MADNPTALTALIQWAEGQLRSLRRSYSDHTGEIEDAAIATEVAYVEHWISELRCGNPSESPNRLSATADPASDTTRATTGERGTCGQDAASAMACLRFVAYKLGAPSYDYADATADLLKREIIDSAQRTAIVERASATNPAPTVAEALKAIDKAHDMVSSLCRGDERWTMRVPADHQRDSDLVISDALIKARRILLAQTGGQECVWTRPDAEEEFYETACGSAWEPMAGMTLSELPAMKFCSNCGLSGIPCGNSNGRG